MSGAGAERMDKMHLSVFHSASNRTRGRRSRNSISSAAWYAFNSFFLFVFKTYLRARRPPGVSEAQRSLHILRIREDRL